MNLQEIEQLIGKYERGETSLRDEMMLRSFFEQEDVPFHLARYRDLFRYFQTAAEDQLNDPGFDSRVREILKDIPEGKTDKGRKKRWYPVYAAAAILILLIAVVFFLQNRTTDTGTFDDPNIAYAETKKVLMKVSGELNTGMDEMVTMQEFHSGIDDLGNVQTFQDGLNNLKKISVLDKSKDIISQKTNTQ